ncbi:MAG: hypothetical protein COT81_05795 [Candidatus Buchananbacteria bacterium CG10_big_fil_rev_8_21_14_0_10_42_9]|uniref:Uncharacterized protein n=1 Tax=Candidatus Buchananbacteria bacterium CG10_big_fil_rev_8_21_14_0_10_42_9 TaxID=1974526 RepID=A0A2H0W255_9BACT|nr:MAG: hypothetical protein COT81_05795 [Candidatus Buchananbacteria bacterium CG10_big_fil_rev_8_21_14_0_10_42_9]
MLSEIPGPSPEDTSQHSFEGESDDVLDLKMSKAILAAILRKKAVNERQEGDGGSAQEYDQKAAMIESELEAFDPSQLTGELKQDFEEAFAAIGGNYFLIENYGSPVEHDSNVQDNELDAQPHEEKGGDDKESFLKSDPVIKKLCPNCYIGNLPDSNFCANCGNAFNPESETEDEEDEREDEMSKKIENTQSVDELVEVVSRIDRIPTSDPSAKDGYFSGREIADQIVRVREERDRPGAIAGGIYRTLPRAFGIRTKTAEFLNPELLPKE